MGLSCMLATVVAHAAAACPSIAVVQGAPQIADAVRAILRAHEIPVGPASATVTDRDDCRDRGVQAWLLPDADGRGYTLHIADPF